MPGNLMTLDEMRQHEWIVSWSGGKDSTATIILMHENNIPIKEIVYVRMMYDDTIPATLPIMTNFVDKSKITLESWGYNVRIVYPDKTANDYMNATYKKSKYPDRIGKQYGITAFMRQMCKLEGEKEKAIKTSINNRTK